MPHGEVLEIGRTIQEAAHRPVCTCGWVDRAYPLGHLDDARTALHRHKETHQ